MIKFSSLKTLQRLPYFLERSRFYFCRSKKPQPQNNNNERPEIKKTLGSRYIHPFKNMMMIKLRQKMKQRQKSQRYMARKINRTSNVNIHQQIQNQQKAQKQKQQNDQQTKKGQNAKKIKRLLYWILFFSLTTLINPQEELIQTPKRSTIKDLLDILQKQPDPFTIKIVKRQRQSKITVYSDKYNRPIGIIDVDKLPEFLEGIQHYLVHKRINIQFKYLPISEFGKYANWIPIAFNIMIVLLVYKYFKWKNTFGSNPMTQGFQQLLGKNNFKPIRPDKINIYFKDVAGLHQAKVQVTQFVDFLKIPQKYIQMGAKVPKGALLTGPPGTGKTLLAKACAGQAGVPFFYVSGSDFVQKYSGLGASRVRSLFNEAEKNSPSIIFIDQIDAIGKKRDSGPVSNQQRDNTLNQLLVRMDGFDTHNKVIVMAATNRKDMLDPALLRPGRFDRTIQITVPNFQQRKQILKVHLKKIKYDQKFTEEQLAKKISVLTPGFSGAQLANVCNEAAILAARQNKSQVAIPLFQKATQRVMAGLQKRNLFSDEQRQILAFYECGKAVTSWFTQGSDPIIKISILPFSKSGKGYSHSIKDQTSLNTKNQLLAKACCYLAGRAAQKHFKGYITTNGDNDLQRAKRIISLIVTKFGMSDSLKMIAFPDIDFTRKPYSENIQALIDRQISKLTESCQQKVQNVIKEKQNEIIKLKEQLIKKQTLTHQCIKQVLGDRPAGNNQTYNIFLKEEQEKNKKDEPISEVNIKYKRV